MFHTDFRKKYCSGSVTVEAACIMPVILTVFMFMVWMLDCIRVHSEIDAKLACIGHDLVMASYATSEIGGALFDDNVAMQNVSSLVLSETLIRSQIESLDIAPKISLLSVGLSEAFSDDGISLVAMYKVKPYLTIPGLSGMWLKSVCYAKPCTGYERENEISPQMVYISGREEVYHTSINCQALCTNVKKVPASDLATLRNNNRAKYYPCEICSQGEVTAYVYVTAYGTRYHCDANCNNLKRTYTEVPLSEVMGRRKCLLCP